MTVGVSPAERTLRDLFGTVAFQELRSHSGLRGYGIFAEKMIGTRDTEGKKIKGHGMFEKEIWRYSTGS